MPTKVQTAVKLDSNSPSDKISLALVSETEGDSFEYSAVDCTKQFACTGMINLMHFGDNAVMTLGLVNMPRTKPTMADFPIMGETDIQLVSKLTSANCYYSQS